MTTVDRRAVQEEAIQLLRHYMEFIQDDVRATDLERHPYVPRIELCIEALEQFSFADVRQGSVGTAVPMPGVNGAFTMAAFPAENVPAGTSLYLHPSSNAQAVAWQCRIPGHKFYGEWSACTKEAFDDPGDKWEVRALCVCSGDAKEA